MDISGYTNLAQAANEGASSLTINSLSKSAKTSLNTSDSDSDSSSGSGDTVSISDEAKALSASSAAVVRHFRGHGATLSASSSDPPRPMTTIGNRGEKFSSRSRKSSSRSRGPAGQQPEFRAEDQKVQLLQSQLMMLQTQLCRPRPKAPHHLQLQWRHQRRGHGQQPHRSLDEKGRGRRPCTPAKGPRPFGIPLPSMMARTAHAPSGPSCSGRVLAESIRSGERRGSERCAEESVSLGPCSRARVRGLWPAESRRVRRGSGGRAAPRRGSRGGRPWFSPYSSVPSKRRAISLAAFRPAPMALMTVAAPVTMSPPAKTLWMLVSPVSGLASM